MIAQHEIAPKGPVPFGSIAGEIPVLRTERLTLRAPQIGDFPVLADIGMGPRGVGIGGPYDREDMWFDFAQMTATWVWRGHGYWTVTARDDDAALGFVGVGFEPGDQEPELGFMFSAEAEGHGLATEAARAALDHTRQAGLVDSLVSYIFADNHRSIAVARRLGAVIDQDAIAAIGEENLTVWRHDMTGGTA